MAVGGPSLTAYNRPALAQKALRHQQFLLKFNTAKPPPSQRGSVRPSPRQTYGLDTTASRRKDLVCQTPSNRACSFMSQRSLQTLHCFRKPMLYRPGDTRDPLASVSNVSKCVAWYSVRVASSTSKAM